MAICHETPVYVSKQISSYGPDGVLLLLGNIYDFYWSMGLMGFALEIIRKYDWVMNCNGSKL